MIEPATYGSDCVSHRSFEPVVLEDRVAVALLVERQVVLEARAAATAHAHPQAGRLHVGVLAGEELAYLLGALVGDGDHDESCLPVVTLHKE